MAGDSSDFPRFVVQVVVSLVLLVVGMYVLIFGHYDAALQKLAAGWVGAVVGFWLS